MALRVLWEVEVDVKPPAAIRPLKPKAYLAKRVNMKEGQYYAIFP